MGKRDVVPPIALFLPLITWLLGRLLDTGQRRVRGAMAESKAWQPMRIQSPAILVQLQMMKNLNLGHYEQVRGLTFVLPGNAVVSDPASFAYYWQLAPAFVVESIWKVETAPTGAAILANIELQGDDLHATEISISSTTEVSSGVDIQNYELGLGETITVTFSQVGSTIPGGNSALVTIVIITP